MVTENDVMPRMLLAGLVGVAVTAVLLVVLPWALQRRLIYLPSVAPVPRAGHVLPVEKPDEVAREVEAFAEEVN